MFGFIILSFSVLNPVSVFASQSSVSQPVPVDEDEEDRQEVKISRKKLMSCPGRHHQSFPPPSLLSRKQGAEAEDEAEDAAEDGDEAVFHRVG